MWNAAFEQKEYMEGYVAEELARTMLKPIRRSSRGLRSRRSPIRRSPPAPTRRLDWFYRRSPAWDERVGLIPVFRVDAGAGAGAVAPHGRAANRRWRRRHSATASAMSPSPPMAPPTTAGHGVRWRGR
jgi:hypothetical protein